MESLSYISSNLFQVRIFYIQQLIFSHLSLVWKYDTNNYANQIQSFFQYILIFNFKKC